MEDFLEVAYDTFLNPEVFHWFISIQEKLNHDSRLLKKYESKRLSKTFKNSLLNIVCNGNDKHSSDNIKFNRPLVQLKRPCRLVSMY